MIPVTAMLENSPALLREFRRLGSALDLDAQGVMQRAGRAAAVAGMRMTQPFGNTKKSQKQGEGAVLMGVVSALQRNDNASTGLGQAAQHHRSKRDGRGKVPRGADKIDAPKQVIDALINQQQAKVGRAKAGFGAAALELGASRVPKWISRHKASWSHTTKARRRWSPSVTITSRLRYASATLTEAQQKKAAAMGIKSALWAMNRQIEGQANRFNRRQRR